jgi:hypothetical protein
LASEDTKEFTQLCWYHARLLQQANCFTAFSHLQSEYMCDMYSQVEDQCLDYIKKARNKQLPDAQFCKANIPGEDNDDQASQDELDTSTALPASFLGS